MLKKKKKASSGGRPLEGIPAAARKRFDGSVVLVVAENISHLRLRLGVSQETLAALSGVGRNTLIAMERAERASNVAQIEKVALALDVAPFELMRP
jgi:DNA-binding XRE family transcriptional regulator